MPFERIKALNIKNLDEKSKNLEGDRPFGSEFRGNPWKSRRIGQDQGEAVEPGAGANLVGSPG